MVFRWATFFCQDVTDNCALAGSAGAPPLPAAYMAWDRLVSAGRMLTMLGLDVHDISLASGTADVLGFEVSPVERANGYHVFVQSHGRSLRAVSSTVGRWSSSTVTNLFWRCAIVGLSQSLMHASSSRGVFLVSGEPWSTVRMEQRAFGRNSVSPPQCLESSLA